MAGFSAQGSEAEVRMSIGLHSFLEALGKNLIPSPFRFLAEFKFLVVVGLRCLFSCYLSAESCSQHLEAVCLPCHVDSSNFKASK